MAKKLLILLFISLLSVPHLLQPAYSFLYSTSDQPVPLWWEIKILLSSSGTYKIEEGDSSYTAHYGFELLWTGCMEKDNGDYLLYYENSELISFDAEETGIYPEYTKIIHTDDFQDKPSIKLNYILRKGENLHFDFFVKSFPVPKNKSKHKYQLCLPASKENSLRSSKIDYNSHIIQGSNLIFLEEKEIFLDTVEKKFFWRWSYQKPKIPQSMPAFFFNSHDVIVEISIEPRF
ncbi:MAG: hypothetical protein GTO16_07880 [Candidatus Aminicenantes bacterium]|nr:hypothetical protein [Candidatus Aminicenantes bacterium]